MAVTTERALYPEAGGPPLAAGAVSVCLVLCGPEDQPGRAALHQLSHSHSQTAVHVGLL